MAISLSDYGIYDAEQLIEKIYQWLKNYYDYPDTVFEVNKRMDKIYFKADDLDWLSEKSEEPEFWQYIRSMSNYGIDFDGPFYMLDINTIFQKQGDKV